MRFSTSILYLSLSTFLLISCTDKRNPQTLDKPLSELSPLNKEKFVVKRKIKLESSMKKVFNEKKVSFSDEFRKYKLALADYRKTSAYRNTSDDDKTLAALVDYSNLMTKEFAKKKIQEGRFSEYHNRIQRKLPEYEEGTRKVFADPKAKNTLQLTAENQPTKDRSKTEFQQATGVAILSTVAALGMLEYRFRLITDHTADWKRSKWGTRLALAGYAGAAVSLGILIIASDNVSSETITATQVLVGIPAAMTAIAALQRLFVSFTSGIIWRESYLSSLRGGWVSEGIRYVSKMATLKAGLYGLGFAALSTGLFVWSVNLGEGLDLAQELSPQEVVKAKILRFFTVAQILEKKWHD